MCFNRRISFFARWKGYIQALLSVLSGIHCVFPEAIKLVCPVESLAHEAACCNLQLGEGGRGGGTYFLRHRGDGVLYRFRIRLSFFLSNVSVCCFGCVSQPPPHPHRTPPSHSVSLLLLPCATVCPRGCNLACTWACACSGPGWNINYAQRLGVYFRCLRQVRIGRSHGGVGGGGGGSCD